MSKTDPMQDKTLARQLQDLTEAIHDLVQVFMEAVFGIVPKDKPEWNYLYSAEHLASITPYHITECKRTLDKYSLKWFTEMERFELAQQELHNRTARNI